MINNKERASILPDYSENGAITEEIDASATREPRDDDACHKEGKGTGKGKEGVCTRELPPDLEAFRLRVGALIKRRPATHWSSNEIKALKEIFDFNTPEEDLVALEARYQSDDKYLRRELMTLLNNWNGEIDKSRSISLSGNNGTGAYSADIANWQ